MKRILRAVLPLLVALPVAASVQAADFDTKVSMVSGGAATFYVPGRIPGAGPTDFMVDTGAGYSAINQETLDSLLQAGEAYYVKDLVGVLANGSRMIVKVYRVSAINVGGNCWLHDVDAAVFPGKTRQILGLSALSKASPFIFSVDPPQLSLSNCASAPKGADDKPIDTVEAPVAATQVAASEPIAEPLVMRVASDQGAAESVSTSKVPNAD